MTTISCLNHYFKYRNHVKKLVLIVCSIWRNISLPRAAGLVGLGSAAFHLNYKRKRKRKAKIKLIGNQKNIHMLHKLFIFRGSTISVTVIVEGNEVRVQILEDEINHISFLANSHLGKVGFICK